MNMAQIKHIAFRTRDVAKTASFYKEAFGLKEVGTGQSGVYLTDGHLNIAILSLRPGMEGESMKLGVDHIGFHVEDMDATISRINQLGGKALNEPHQSAPSDPASPRSYFEIKCLCPDDQVIDVSTAGWVGAK
jgi:catechol 2,3-dioxygenase-like lactoylglutathione lyase family enzyme